MTVNVSLLHFAAYPVALVAPSEQEQGYGDNEGGNADEYPHGVIVPAPLERGFA